MATLLKGRVLPARDHALPFRVIFEELLQRREQEVKEQARLRLNANAGQEVTALDTALTAQETAYEKLQRAQDEIAAGTRHVSADDELTKCDAADKPLKKMLHGIPRSALSLSGGGIRSASFSLGVMEGLSRFSRDSKDCKESVMDGLDYLSTVSGGGYIGSWLMSWVWRRYLLDGKDNWQDAYRKVVSALAGSRNVSSCLGIPEPQPVTGGDPEPQTKRHLRSYTSFLAPALGATVDTATLGAIVLRNLLVNWVMLIPLLLAVVSGARGLGRWLLWCQKVFEQGQAILWWRDGEVLLCFFVAALIAALALPSHDEKRSLRHMKVVAPAAAPVVVPLVVPAASVEAPDAAAAAATEAVKEPPFEWRAYAGPAFVVLVLLGSGALAVSQKRSRGGDAPSFWVESAIALVGFAILAFSIARAEGRRIDATQAAMQKKAEKVPGMLAPNYSTTVRKFSLWAAAIGATFFCAFLSSGLLLALRQYGYTFLLTGGGIDPFKVKVAQDRLFVLLSVPSITAILLISATMLCALLGVFERDEDREWWARCGGALIGLNLCWIVGQGFVFYGASVQDRLIATVAGLALAGLSSLGGFSGATAGVEGVPAVAKLKGVGKFLSKHKLLLPAAGVVSVLLIAIGVVALEEILRIALRDSVACMLPHVPAWLPGVASLLRCVSRHPDGGSAFLLFLLAAPLTVLLNLAININLFSLQGMYRMRLMRAYLGASNVFRRPDPFTGFDPRDTPRMFQMPCTAGVPMHLINCTLNLTGTANTAWRQRRAEIFGFSPLVCGGWRTGYVRTEDYASRHNGPDLAAAMSISGSAFNPNMGYHTSPLLSILMTFFDVRLGAWLPNPKWPSLKGWTCARDEGKIERFIRRPGPLFALSPLVQELLGSADDTRPYVELTDGGHFEDLALYEMVMRRVKTIILVDAGADPDYQFEDLGNAIRKIQIDLGITIEFNGAMPMEKPISDKNLYCAVGTIRYGCVDEDPGCNGAQYDGKLIYIKPVLTGKEPADIFQYAQTHDTFPHETTVNQFFNEAQFESYRHLGSFMIDILVGASVLPADRPGNYGSLQGFLDLATAFGKMQPAADNPQVQ